MRTFFSMLAAILLCSACSTLTRAPGTETPGLIEQTHGSLLLETIGAAELQPTIVLVDFPSLRTRKVQRAKRALASSAVDERGRVVYVVDANRNRPLWRDFIESW